MYFRDHSYHDKHSFQSKNARDVPSATEQISLTWFFGSVMGIRNVSRYHLPL